VFFQIRAYKNSLTHFFHYISLCFFLIESCSIQNRRWWKLSRSWKVYDTGGCWYI